MLKRLLNLPEQITFHRLGEICARRLAKVYTKVRLADVLPVEGSGLPDTLYEFALQAHYDFVITDTGQRPLFAVEFDGPQHNSPIQAERDAKKDELSRRFGLPLLRVRAGDLYRTEWRFDRLTELVERWFDVNGTGPGGGSVKLARPTTELKTEGSNQAVWPSCPTCGSGMVEKNGKYGPFLSCDRFPACKGSRDLPGPTGRSRSEVGEVCAPKNPGLRRSALIAGTVACVLTASIMTMFLVWPRTVEPRAEVQPSALQNDLPGLPSTPGSPRFPVGVPPSTLSNDSPATVPQRNLLGLLIQRRGWGAEERNAQVAHVLGYDRRFTELRKKEASRLITAWDDREK